MGDRRETFAGSLSGDQIGKTITVPNSSGEVITGVLEVIVHHRHGVVGVFFDDGKAPELVSADAIAVVS